MDDQFLTQEEEQEISLHTEEEDGELNIETDKRKLIAVINKNGILLN